MKIRIILFILLTGFCLQSEAQRSDKNASPEMTDGVVYSLPRTGVRIFVTATREKYFAGPYAQYADVMLGLKNAPVSDQEKWTITNIEIKTFSEADPNQVYKAKGAIGALVNLTSDGVIAGVNSPESTSGVACSPVTTFLDSTPIPDYPFKDLSLSPFVEKPDSAAANVLIAKTQQEKAQEAAHTVTKLRKRRFKTLANGYEEQLPDGKAYKVMVDELGALEEEYVALFIGKSYTATYQYCFDYIPNDNAGSGEVVFRFSDSKGVLPTTDLSGKPMQVDLRKVSDLASAQSKQKSAGASADAGKSGVYYRSPGKAEFKLMNGVQLMALTRLDIAQFGTVIPVPEELLDGNHAITFHPETGAIKSIAVE